MKKSLPIIVGVTLVVSLFAPVNSQVSAASVNGSCRKVGTKAGTTKKPLVCKKVGKKLIWKSVTVTTVPKLTPSASIVPVTTVATVNSSAPVAATVAPLPTSLTTTTVAPAALNESVSQSNARKKGASYLKSSSFSRTGLIKQLEFEGFSNADSVYGTDAQNADWNAQAVLKGASYLKSSSFSRSGLVKQLVFEGFTDAQAEVGVAAGNTDWNVQAGKKAASYLKSSSFSRKGLIDQLLYEGFTQAQAEYGVGTTGL